MSEGGYDAGADDSYHDDGDSGGDTGDTSGGHVIVTEFSDGSTVVVGDTNADGYAVYDNEFGHDHALDTAQYDGLDTDRDGDHDLDTVHYAYPHAHPLTAS